MLTCRYCKSFRDNSCWNAYTVHDVNADTPACSNIFFDSIYTGKVTMTAVDAMGDTLHSSEFDHSTREGRNEVRIFVNYWLNEGALILTKPIGG